MHGTGFIREANLRAQKAQLSQLETPAIQAIVDEWGQLSLGRKILETLSGRDVRVDAARELLEKPGELDAWRNASFNGPRS